MAKRGRPDVYAANNMNDLKELFQGLKPGLSNREYANIFYMGQGEAILAEAIDEKSGSDSEMSIEELLADKTFGKIANCNVIMEQIGRMSEQDNIDLESIYQVATIAAEKYENGETAHAIAQYLRTVRKTHVLYPEESPKKKRVDLTKEEQEITQIILFKAVHDLQKASDSGSDSDIESELSILKSAYQKISNPDRTGILQAMFPDD